MVHKWTLKLADRSSDPPQISYLRRDNREKIPIKLKMRTTLLFVLISALVVSTQQTSSRAAMQKNAAAHAAAYSKQQLIAILADDAKLQAFTEEQFSSFDRREAKSLITFDVLHGIKWTGWSSIIK